METLHWQKNFYRDSLPTPFLGITKENISSARNFHKTIPGYIKTPLNSLSALAAYLGVNSILVKDESLRFGLEAFKVLGSSYAVADFLADLYEEPYLSFPSIKEKCKSFPPLSFATATDGNHGRGLAWAAMQFDQRAIVHMPKGSSPCRFNKIRELGADVEITELNYDDTVRRIAQLAENNGWILIQDTSWEGYQKIPLQIMQGYLTIADECLEQLQGEPPTHVILQAGVGSFAAAIALGLKLMIPSPITFIIVEPTKADCFYQSAKSGRAEKASGDLSTIMAGLSCGEPNPQSWEILKQLAAYFFICPDTIAARGMRILGNPLSQDARIISGESGAIPIGLLYELCKNLQFAYLKESLGLNASSRVLCISTEGATDPESYRSICWDGACSS